MRTLLTILWLFVYSVSFARKDAFSLTEKLNEVLVKKDTVALKQLLHNRVVYGHSNGWVQNKAEVIKDLFNGRLSYVSITWNIEDIKNRHDSLRHAGLLIIDGNTKATGLVSGDTKTQILHTTLGYKVLYEGEPLDIKLAVLFVWVKEKGKWKLLARQSTKIN